MDLSLKNKMALICGASQGIGFAVAKELASLGANCILLARNEDSLTKAVSLLDVLSGQIHKYAIADFAKVGEVKKAIEKITATTTIEILINNTGGPAPGALAATDPVLLENAFQQHIINYQHLAQAVIPGMKKNGYGRIINVVSTSVKIPIANLGVSNTIRAATAAWAKTLSLELGKFGITVNNVLPGYTKTQRLESLLKQNSEQKNISRAELEEKMKAGIPAERFGEPHEIAAMAAFLATPAAAYVNGTSIPVDGGSTGAF